ncbi:MAG TPA: exodeoxyribonuclease VII small subunit [Campylobacterales bacterium]|nr:exodeoxyribonuclease VII small subunit [Campylobacterales bacterium]HIP41883.1 exodeoxyribonuclease VII small subunit [Campylobacterales bacterium]
MTTDTFENRLERSKLILNQLMDPSITLEESLKLYEEGLKQIQLAQKMIEKAKVKITTIERKK